MFYLKYLQIMQIDRTTQWVLNRNVSTCVNEKWRTWKKYDEVWQAGFARHMLTSGLPISVS